METKIMDDSELKIFPPARVSPHDALELPTGVSHRLTNAYIKAASADNTRRSYRSDVRHFERWGGRLPATSEMIIHYLESYAATLNPRTLQRRVTALKQWHLYQGFTDPTHHPVVSKMLKGICRIHGKPRAKAHPLDVDELRKLVEPLQRSQTLAARRDNAMFQLAFCGALRQSELVLLRVEDLTWVTKGIDVLIPHSKTDSSHQGQFVAIPYGVQPLCAVTALQQWLLSANLTTGYLFCAIAKGNQISTKPLSGRSINLILKKRALECGLSIKTLSSHSFRRGITTLASQAGSDMSAIMRHGRWKNVNTVMEYIDASERFTNNVAGNVLTTFGVAKK